MLAGSKTKSITTKDEEGLEIISIPVRATSKEARDKEFVALPKWHGLMDNGFRITTALELHVNPAEDVEHFSRSEMESDASLRKIRRH